MTNTDIINAAKTLTLDEELPLCECGCGDSVAKKGNRFIFGHNRRGEKHSLKSIEKMNIANSGKNNGMYGKRHSTETRAKISKTLTKPKPKRKLCKCGCGKLANSGRDYINGHYARGKERALSHCNALSKAKKGVPLSPSLLTAIRKIHKEHPEIWYDHYEKQRGGNDTINHHYIYDHSDLSKYTMKVTRSKHAKIHAWMRKAGINVPHINVEKDGKK